MHRKLIFIICIFGIIWEVKSQDKTDNYSFIKLYVTNDRHEVLLVGGGDTWEITGARYNDTISIHDFLNWMGQRMGIQIKKIRLRGLFTFHYAWKKNPTLMHYYTAEYESGELIIPEGCEGIKWVNRNEVQSLIPYKEMNEIINKINECDYLLGGSVRVYKDSLSNKRTSKMTEEFYQLN